MDFLAALKQRVPMQVRVSKRHQPLATDVTYAAEVFLVDTTHGSRILLCSSTG
jgi:hypothetical protein